VERKLNGGGIGINTWDVRVATNQTALSVTYHTAIRTPSVACSMSAATGFG